MKVTLDSPELWVLLFGGVFALCAGFTIFARWCLQSPAVPAEKLNRLRVGLHTREVRELLGDPRHETTHHDLPEWHFGHRLKRHILVVRFDEHGIVRQFHHLNAREAEPRERT